jgi:aerobic carbon-monoxide dehydrogenase small subunit
MANIQININGKSVSADVDERTLLLEFVRNTAGLTGTHNGCLEARCGCCAVELDGHVVKSCNVLALQAAGCSVKTVESLSPIGVTRLEHITTQTLAGVYEPLDVKGIDVETLHPLQKAFHRRHALQCGFCTPGMLMVLKDFLQENPSPTREEVRMAIAGNICRCTGYQHIIDAAMDAAAEMRSSQNSGPALVDV